MEALIKEIKQLKKENQKLKKIIRDIEKILKIKITEAPKTVTDKHFNGVKDLNRNE